MDSPVPRPAQPTGLILVTTSHPSHNQEPIAMVKNALRGALDDLEATGILHGRSRMGIDALMPY